MKKYKFIDLFSGIGGFHIAFENVGAECVFACDKDKWARQVYQANFNMPPDRLAEDITTVNPADIPDFDILCAGFPCQSFSILGRRKGFADEIRGTMFFYILEILKQRRPKAFFLENVKGLLTAQDGECFRIISESLQELGYSFNYKIVKGTDHNIPQVRQRVFIIGFLGDTVDSTFEFAPQVPLTKTLEEIFECQTINRKIARTMVSSFTGMPPQSFRCWDYYIVDGMGRRLTAKEGKRIMGFPDSFDMSSVSNERAIRQLGNAVIVPAIQANAEQLIKYLRKMDEKGLFSFNNLCKVVPVNDDFKTGIVNENLKLAENAA